MKCECIYQEQWHDNTAMGIEPMDILFICKFDDLIMCL